MTSITRDPRPDARPTWDDLTPDEQLKELLLGSASEFYRVFEDDPCTVIACPEDGPQIVTATLTTCDACGRELANLRPDPVRSEDWRLEGWAA